MPLMSAPHEVYALDIPRWWAIGGDQDLVDKLAFKKLEIEYRIFLFDTKSYFDSKFTASWQNFMLFRISGYRTTVAHKNIGQNKLQAPSQRRRTRGPLGPHFYFCRRLRSSPHMLSNYLGLLIGITSANNNLDWTGTNWAYLIILILPFPSQIYLFALSVEPNSLFHATARPRIRPNPRYAWCKYAVVQ